MPEPDDIALLRQYAEENSEAAFTALLERHVNLVYSTALRRIGSPHAAEEITQAVFIILTRKAKSLGAKTVLSGWLYHTTRLTAANFLRGAIRRQRREQEAHMQSTLDQQPPGEAWAQIAPLLEDAMAKLAARDRDAIVLRYFENKTLREVGAKLGASEDAAKMRLNRALEKLRKMFAQQGVNSTTSVIAGVIASHSVHAAPLGLVKTISAVMIAKGTAAAGTPLALAKGVLKIMAWTKAKTAIAVAAVAVLAIGTTVTTIAVQKSHRDAVENYFTHWDSMNIDTAPLPPVVVVRPSKYMNRGDYIIVSTTNEKIMRRAAGFPEILATAYDFSPEQMILPTNLPRGQFDMLLTAPTDSREKLRAEIKRQFGVVAHTEAREMDVLVLKVINPNAPGLKISAGGGPNIWTENGSIKLLGYKMADFTHVIGVFFSHPVIDETGLSDAYDVEAKWDSHLKGNALQTEIENIMRNQFGLELTPDKRSVQMLVVEKMN
jgi:uncharacterized protein (TIGR03435 family)